VFLNGNAGAKQSETVAVEIVERDRASRQRKEQRFARSEHEWTVTVSEVDIGCLDAKTVGPSVPTEHPSARDDTPQ
jgi:hypothetical protein